MDIKCPKCNDARVQLVHHQGINILVCGEGHVIAIDNTEHLKLVANSVSNAVVALADTVNAQMMENRNELRQAFKALTEAVSGKN